MATPNPQFVSLEEYCPGIIIQVNYSTINNFTGVVVAGYRAKKAYLARSTADALARVQNKALKENLSLKIFDAYRPVKAVTFFQEWAKLPENHPEIKAIHYPKFSRLELFTNGYIADQSSHSRGSALDLTLYDLKSKQDVDMGGVFDYFDDVSSTETPLITKAQQKNRYLLKALMESEGFKNFSQEWWHYSLKPEPFPDQYFDFDVE